MGVDFSWLDSCDVQPDGPNYLGDGKDFAMTYGLMETTAIHDGYVRDWGNSRRMFALPRSSYAGMQRTGQLHTSCHDIINPCRSHSSYQIQLTAKDRKSS